MNSIIFDLPAGDLASRKNAIATRESLKALWVTHELVIVNCKNVEALSESYADELFGVLVLEEGYERVIQHLKIQAAETHVLLSIASVIKRRKQQMVSSKPLAKVSQHQFCHA